jgi:hypothetical protein
MLKLDERTFTRAIEKARSVQPRVINIGAHYGVQRSDGGIAHVIFTAYRGGIWASCSCPAHMRGTRDGVPLPCYHIAAAAMSRQPRAAVSQPVAAPAPAVPAPSHAHACPRCGDLYSCRCPLAEMDDLICDACDALTISRA